MNDHQLATLDAPQALAVSEPAPPAHDLRHALMTLDVPNQNRLLKEYKERRDNFRDWLLSQLIPGVHMGFPPGCEPKSQVRNDGTVWYSQWSKGRETWYPETQWKPKPELYAAGADFICDLLGVRDEYESDAVAWQQMGSKAGTAVQKCRLISRETKEIVGEGLGAYHNGSDPNNAVKMASKCAKCGAVINCYGLRDLFTQEIPRTAPPNENPPPDESAPKAAPRAARAAVAPQTEVSLAQLGHVTSHWKSTHPEPDGDVNKQRAKFRTWAQWAAKREFDASKLPLWKLADYQACCDALKIPTLEDFK